MITITKTKAGFDVQVDGYRQSKLNFNDARLFAIDMTTEVYFKELKNFEAKQRELEEQKYELIKIFRKEMQALLKAKKLADGTLMINENENLQFHKGDKVFVKDGSYTNQQGEVIEDDPNNPIYKPEYVLVNLQYGPIVALLPDQLKKLDEFIEWGC